MNINNDNFEAQRCLKNQLLALNQDVEDRLLLIEQIAG